MYIYNYDGADPRRLGVQNVPENFVLKVGDTELIRNVDYTLIDSLHTNGYWQPANLTTQWFLFFIGDTTGISWSDLKDNSIWPYQNDTWVTITYQTPLTAIVGEGSNEIPLKDAFQWAKGDYFSHLQNWIYGYNSIKDVDNVATVRWGIRKSGIVNGNTITYKVEVRTEHFDLADVLTDVFDPLLEYVPFSMRIWKRDAPGTYYGPYEMIAGTFTDMLSANISGNTMSFDFLNMYRVNWGADGAEYYPDPTLLSDATPAAESYIIEFKMRLQEDAPLGQHMVVNRVKINGFTSSSTNDIGTKVVDKTMFASSNIASVSILINPDEKVLDGTAGKYTVTDILSDTLAIYLSTIVVEAWEGGAWVVHPLVNSTSGELWTYTTTTLGSGNFGFSLSNLMPGNTYYYKITEDTDLADTGWTFDPNATSGYIVIVTVSAGGAVNVSYPGGASEVTFVNEYSGEISPAHIVLSANKLAAGAGLPCGRFVFGLFDEDGSLIETATNGTADEKF